MTDDHMETLIHGKLGARDGRDCHACPAGDSICFQACKDALQIASQPVLACDSFQTRPVVDPFYLRARVKLRDSDLYPVMS